MDRPNIVLLVVDCLRTDRLGCYGASRTATPHIDRMAARGVLFEQAVASGFQTLTTMASVMSGCYPSTYGGFARLADERPRLANVLQSLGYHTAAFTANPYLSRDRGYALGFDHFDECKPELSPASTTPRGWLIRGFNRIFKRWGIGIECPPYLDAQSMTDRVLDWVAEVPEPFFLWVHYMDAHAPYHLSRCSLALPRGLGQRPYPYGFWRHLRLNADRVTAKEVAVVEKLYEAGISFVDSQIQRLVPALTDRGQESRTAIVVTADHGDELFEHGIFAHSRNLYETIVHIPLIVAPGTSLAAGQRVSTQVRQVDLAPSLIALAGGQPPETMQGLDLASALQGQPWSVPLPAISQTNPADSWFLSLREPPWKLIWGLEPDTLETRSVELYHLPRDPGEYKNVAAAYPDRVTSMLATLRQHIPNLDLTRFSEHEEIDPDVLARLEALGYVNGGG